MTHNNHFDLIAPIYDQIFKAGQINVILPKIQQFKNGLFLDAGGGTGRISKLFVDIAKGFIVADTSYRMLEQVKKKGLIPLCTNVEILPFNDEAFDLVLLIDALHHIARQNIAIVELWRVVRPGGILVIQEPDIEKFTGKLIAIIEKILLMKSKFLTCSAILKILPFENSKRYHLKVDNSFFVIAEKGIYDS